MDLSVNPVYFPNLQPKELNYFGQLVNADINQVIQYFLAYYYKHHGSRHWRKDDTRDRQPILAWQTIHHALSQQEGFTLLKNDLDNPSQGFLKFVELIESDMQQLSKRELSAHVTYKMRVYLLCSRFLLAVVLNLSMLSKKVRARYIKKYNKWKVNHPNHPVAKLPAKESFLAHVLISREHEIMCYLHELKASHFPDSRIRDIIEGSVWFWIDWVVRDIRKGRNSGMEYMPAFDPFKSFVVLDLEDESSQVHFIANLNYCLTFIISIFICFIFFSAL